MGPEASSDEYVSVNSFIGGVEAEIPIAVVVCMVALLAFVLSAGLGKMSAAVKTKSAVSLLAWVMSNPVALPLVLALFFALAIPCRSRGLG